MLDGIGPDRVVTRVRPGLILQADAASEISRYFLGRLIPGAVVRRSVLRFTPFPKAIAVQLVHADDVARAFVTIIERQAAGAFNLAAEPVIDRAGFRAAFGGIGPSVPVSILRALVDLTWRAHLQPTDAGWVNLGASVPLMDVSRARRELDWSPVHAADVTLREFVDALNRGHGAAGPLLYPSHGD